MHRTLPKMNIIIFDIILLEVKIDISAGRYMSDTCANMLDTTSPTVLVGFFC